MTGTFFTLTAIGPSLHSIHWPHLPRRLETQWETCRETHQVGETVCLHSSSQPFGVREATDVLDVGPKSWRVGHEQDINECWEEVVSWGQRFLGADDGAADVIAAVCDTLKFVLRSLPSVHLSHIWKNIGRWFISGFNVWVKTFNILLYTFWMTWCIWKNILLFFLIFISFFF